MSSTPAEDIDPESLCALHCPKSMRKKFYGNNPWYCDRVKVGKFSYVWNIEKFGDFKERAVSPIFAAANEYNNIKWQLTMSEGDSSIVLLMKLISSEYNHIEFKFGISILKSNGERDNSLGKWNGVGTPYGAFMFPRNIQISELMDSSRGFLVNGSLILICDMTMMIDAIDSSPKDLSDLDSYEPSIHQEMAKLLETGKFSDITLIVEDREFYVHKAILSMRSEVFAAMFEHKTLAENQKNQIIIEDFDYPVIKELLTFIYCNRSPNIDEMAAELLPVADKYAINQLKTMCEIVLYRDITYDNALHTLVLADYHSAPTLRARAVHFIRANYSSIEDTADYEKLSMDYSSFISEIEGYDGCLHNLNVK